MKINQTVPSDTADETPNSPNDHVMRSAARSKEARKRIAAHIYETPLLPSRSVGHKYGSTVLFKADNFQITGSFKLRGATSKMTSLPVDQPIITASSGNHGIACARAASATGHSLTIVLPETVARAKLEAIRAAGGTVELYGSESGQAELHARRLADERGQIYVSPYNDLEVIAGQGTIGLELLEQAAHIDNVFISMGGGGLIAGIGAALKAHSPQIRVIGVAAENSCALAASIAAGEVVETEHHATLADGVAGGVDQGSLTLPLALSVVDEVITCSEDQIAAALIEMAHGEKQLVEGAAALALAGYIAQADAFKDQVNVILLCGANYDTDTIMPIIAGETDLT